MKWLKPAAPILFLLCLALAQSVFWQDSKGKIIALPDQPAAIEFSPIEKELTKIVVDKNQQLVFDHKTAASLQRVTALIADMNATDQQRFKFLLQHSFEQNRAQKLLVILASYQQYRTKLSKLPSLEQSKNPEYLQASIEAIQVELFGPVRAAKLFSDENKIKRFLAIQQKKYLRSQVL